MCTQARLHTTILHSIRPRLAFLRIAIVATTSILVALIDVVNFTPVARVVDCIAPSAILRRISIAQSYYLLLGTNLALLTTLLAITPVGFGTFHQCRSALFQDGRVHVDATLRDVVGIRGCDAGLSKASQG